MYLCVCVCVVSEKISVIINNRVRVLSSSRLRLTPGTSKRSGTAKRTADPIRSGPTAWTGWAATVVMAVTGAVEELGAGAGMAVGGGGGGWGGEMGRRERRGC